MFLSLIFFFCFLLFFLTLSWQIVGSKLFSICKEKDKDKDKKKEKNAQKIFQTLGESNGKYLISNYENIKLFYLIFIIAFEISDIFNISFVLLKFSIE